MAGLVDKRKHFGEILLRVSLAIKHLENLQTHLEDSFIDSF
jgi:hypothetical protein